MISADALALHYIVAAGYDPHEAPRAVKSLTANRDEQSEIHNFFFGRHSTARARIWQFNNLIKAYYPNVEPLGRVRSTPEYDRLARRYWGKQKVAAATAAP